MKLLTVQLKVTLPHSFESNWLYELIFDIFHYKILITDQYI